MKFCFSCWTRIPLLAKKCPNSLSKQNVFARFCFYGFVIWCAYAFFSSASFQRGWEQGEFESKRDSYSLTHNRDGTPIQFNTPAAPPQVVETQPQFQDTSLERLAPNDSTVKWRHRIQKVTDTVFGSPEGKIEKELNKAIAAGKLNPPVETKEEKIDRLVKELLPNQ